MPIYLKKIRNILFITIFFGLMRISILKVESWGLFWNIIERACLARERKKVMQIFPTRMCVTACRRSRLEFQRLLSLFCLWEESVGGA